MTLTRTGKALLLTSMVGLSLVTATKAVAETEFSMPSIVQDFSNIAAFQLSESGWLETQALSTTVDANLTAHTTTHAHAAAEQLVEIPIQFQGEWNYDLNYCGTPWGDSMLRIGADYIKFYESSGPVVEIVAQGELGLRVTTELSGEGDVWLDQRYFQLSADHQILETKLDEATPGFLRYRCP